MDDQGSVNGYCLGMYVCNGLRWCVCVCRCVGVCVYVYERLCVYKLVYIYIYVLKMLNKYY